LPNVPILTLIFFSLNFLAATQDIAVDVSRGVHWKLLCGFQVLLFCFF
jgi:hypothetical protein